VRPRLLSKSKYLNGLQCPKYLWLLFHDPEKVPEPDEATQYILDQGHVVGELAKRLFPNSVDIPIDDFVENLRQTRELLKNRRPLFEPGFFVDGLYSRLDILNPVANDEWDIIEVKGSTKVKDENIDDVAFQKLCCTRYGLEIRQCHLAYINNQYVRLGEIEPERLFSMQDITAEVAEASNGLEDRISDMIEVISTDTCPDTPVGSQCGEPYACPVTWCWESLPEHHIFQLYRGGRKCSELYNQGILTVKDIPSDFKLSGPQRIQKECTVTGEPHIDKEAINQFLITLQHPLHYLDFETISPVVPMYDGTRPYQRIPFQFSLHTVPDEHAGVLHHSFLADGSGDPRHRLLFELKNILADTGSVVVYNQSFEKGVLLELAEAFPEFEGWVQAVCDRLVDLYVPFRDFHYYHPQQCGSASIKEVVPAVTGKGYEGMSIARGDDASLAFLKLASGELSADERERLRADLEKYCGLDTEGMIWIVDVLRNLSK
jgi:hypothetical protein